MVGQLGQDADMPWLAVARANSRQDLLHDLSRECRDRTSSRVQLAPFSWHMDGGRGVRERGVSSPRAVLSGRGEPARVLSGQTADERVRRTAAPDGTEMLAPSCVCGSKRSCASGFGVYSVSVL